MAANRRYTHGLPWVIVLLILASAACGTISTPPEPHRAAMPLPEWTSQPAATVAGLEVTNGPSGPKTGVSDSNLPVDNSDGSRADKEARNAIDDIQRYWKQNFPEAFGGKQFRPVTRLVSYDSAAPGLILCNETTAGVANAFYCPADDSIAWDRGQLLPALKRSFGPLAAVTVLAHEMGHAIQAQVRTVSRHDPAIVQEQQADCFAGAFFRSMAEGNAPHFHVSTGDGLNQVMGVLSYIRDAPGKSSFTAENAHGSAFDRVTAFQFGFGDGPKRCAGMDIRDVTQRTTEFAFWKAAQKSNLPIDAKSLEQIRVSLGEVFGNAQSAPPITNTLNSCASTKPTSPASYCPETNTVSLNMPALQRIGRPPGGGSATGYGDFAAFAQVASRYALSVQNTAGMPLSGENAALRTACLVGAWSGLLVEDPIGRRNPVGKLRIAPGDVDEGVAALLGKNSLIASDVNGETVPAGFARVEAFRLGFQNGIAPCGTKYAG